MYPPATSAPAGVARIHGCTITIELTLPSHRDHAHIHEDCRPNGKMTQARGICVCSTQHRHRLTPAAHVCATFAGDRPRFEEHAQAECAGKVHGHERSQMGTRRRRSYSPATFAIAFDLAALGQRRVCRHYSMLMMTSLRTTACGRVGDARGFRVQIRKQIPRIDIRDSQGRACVPRGT